MVLLQLKHFVFNTYHLHHYCCQFDGDIYYLVVILQVVFTTESEETISPI